jgi:hypothetical protein
VQYSIPFVLERNAEWDSSNYQRYPFDIDPSCCHRGRDEYAAWACFLELVVTRAALALFFGYLSM